MKAVQGVAGWFLLASAGALWAGCILDFTRLNGGDSVGAGGAGTGGDGGSVTTGGPCCLGVEGSCGPCSRECQPTDCGGKPCVLAENLGNPQGVIVALDYVLWTSRAGGEIGRLNLVNGVVVKFAEQVVAPTLLATNGTLAVWVAEDGIWQCAIANGDCTFTRKQIFPLAAEQAALVRGLAADETNAYWTQDTLDPSGAPMLRCNLNSRCEMDGALFFSNNAHPQGIVADRDPNGYVYWASGSTEAKHGLVQRILKNAQRDGPVAAVASSLDFPIGVALSGSDLLLTTVDPVNQKGTVLRCPQGETLCPGSAVATTPPDNAPGIVNARNIVADETHVYWTNSGSGTVMQCPLPACNGYPGLVADTQQEPSGIALSESCVYWIDQTNGGRLLRQAKPTNP